MARQSDKDDTSRVPSTVGAIPVVGEIAKAAESQARWMQEMLEQNARLVGQMPATMKTFNDSLDRFNQTVARLDAAVSRIELATRTLAVPLERLADVLNPRAVRDLQGALDRVVAVVGELPGAGRLKRRAAKDDAAKGE